MSMVQSRRASNGVDDSHYNDGKKLFIDDRRPRPLPDLDLNSITEVRHKKWVFHRPPPKNFRRLALHPITFVVAVTVAIGLLVYAVVNL